MNKKGISPLIATVLIIGFTVALAALIFTWGADFVKKTTEETSSKTTSALKCANELNFEITDYDCASGSLKLDNRGKIDIKSLLFRVHKGETVTNDATTGASGVGKYEVKSFTLTSAAEKVDAIATIAGASGSGDIVCDQAIEEYTTGC